MTKHIVGGSTNVPRFTNAWPLWLLGIAAALASWFGGPMSPGLRYQRDIILSGEWWRLLTGHLVHLGQSHLLLNLAGLALIGWVFGPGLRALHWLLVLFASWLGLALGFLLLEPQLEWYVGLSGLLHGLLLGALLLDEGLDPRARVALILAVFLKLAWEQWTGELPFTATAAGGPVVVDAHLYGGVGGWLAGIAFRLRARRRGPV